MSVPAPDLTRSLVCFGAVGGAATLAYGAFALLLNRWAGLPVAAASVAAYAGASVISYLGHRNLTFRSGRAHRETVLPFAGATVLGYLLALTVPTILVAGLGAAPETGIAATCILVPALSYLLLNVVVFRKGGER